MGIQIHTMQTLPDKSGYSVGYFATLIVSVPPSTPGGFQVTAQSQELWVEICRFKEILDAVRRVNVLNGGNGQVS